MVRQKNPAYTLPTGELRISIIEDSYASKRGWIPGEKLYQMADYNSQKMSVADYSDEYKAVFRAMIFSYFKNGRKYNNLPACTAQCMLQCRFLSVHYGQRADCCISCL